MAKIHIRKDLDSGFVVGKANTTWIVDKGTDITSDVEVTFFSEWDKTKVIVEGKITNPMDFGIALELNGDDSTAIINQGGVASGLTAGVLLSGHSGMLKNDGLIRGGSAVALVGDDAQVKNTGRIIGVEHAGLEGEGISIEGTDAVIFNAKGGSIRGDTAITMDEDSDHNAIIFNYGTIKADNWAISAGDGEQQVINLGTIKGSILLGDGDDIFMSRRGTLTGEVSGGDGNDTYIIDDASIGIVESAGGGEDWLGTSVDYVLDASLEIELLQAIKKVDIDLTGNQIDNKLVGNDGDNTLSGMGGEDWLMGGAGTDRMTGGDAADQFFFGKGSGRDAVTDFDLSGADHDLVRLVELPSIDDFADLAAIAKDTAKGLVLNFGNGDRLTIEGIEFNDLNASHFEFGFPIP